jgi:hypothetical protein
MRSRDRPRISPMSHSVSRRPAASLFITLATYGVALVVIARVRNAAGGDDAA